MGWGDNYDHLGLGAYWKNGPPKKVPYDWQKHENGIKKYQNGGYILTTDLWF